MDGMSGDLALSATSTPAPFIILDDEEDAAADGVPLDLLDGSCFLTFTAATVLFADFG
jgi:hypothetical protein